MHSLIENVEQNAYLPEKQAPVVSARLLEAFEIISYGQVIIAGHLPTYFFHQ